MNFIYFICIIFYCGYSDFLLQFGSVFGEFFNQFFFKNIFIVQFIFFIKNYLIFFFRFTFFGNLVYYAFQNLYAMFFITSYLFTLNNFYIIIVSAYQLSFLAIFKFFILFFQVFFNGVGYLQQQLINNFSQLSISVFYTRGFSGENEFAPLIQQNYWYDFLGDKSGLDLYWFQIFQFTYDFVISYISYVMIFFFIIIKNIVHIIPVFFNISINVVQSFFSFIVICSYSAQFLVIFKFFCFSFVFLLFFYMSPGVRYFLEFRIFDLFIWFKSTYFFVSIVFQYKFFIVLLDKFIRSAVFAKQFQNMVGFATKNLQHFTNHAYHSNDFQKSLAEQEERAFNKRNMYVDASYQQEEHRIQALYNKIKKNKKDPNSY